MVETTQLGGAPPYAGFVRRVVAFVIDMLILMVPTALVSSIFPPATQLAEIPQDATLPELLAILQPNPSFLIGATLVAWAYKALLEASAMQATLGKRIIGLKVTDLDGRRISIATATIRTWPLWLAPLAAAVGAQLVEAVFSLAAMFSYLAVAATRRKQGLHDIIAGCLVLRGKA